MSFRTIVTIIAFLMLSGCKAHLMTSVDLADLNDKPKEGVARVSIEVAACGTAEDSRKASSSVFEAMDAVYEIFPNAKYDGCHRENFDSITEFVIPVSIGEKSEAMISFIRTDDSALTLYMPEKIGQAINKNKEGAGAYGDVYIQIAVLNSTGKNETHIINSAFVEGHPYLDQPYLFSAGDLTMLIPSNVATRAAILIGEVSLMK